MTQLKVFLCHSSKDKPVARELYKKLHLVGWIDPWLVESEKAVETTID